MRGRIFGPEGLTTIREDEDFVAASSSQPDWIFVSHRRADLEQAEDVAKCISTYGLRAYLDERDPTVDGDSPGLIDYLLEVIHRSSGLVVVASARTVGSWWVPGEVFAAHDNGSLIGTYRLPSIALRDLPSYLLYDWPIMDSHWGLHTWCEQFKKVEVYAMFTALNEGLTKASRVIDQDKFYDSFVNGSGGIRIHRRS